MALSRILNANNIGIESSKHGFLEQSCRALAAFQRMISGSSSGTIDSRFELAIPDSARAELASRPHAGSAANVNSGSLVLILQYVGTRFADRFLCLLREQEDLIEIYWGWEKSA